MFVVVQLNYRHLCFGLLDYLVLDLLSPNSCTVSNKRCIKEIVWIIYEVLINGPTSDGDGQADSLEVHLKKIKCTLYLAYFHRLTLPLDSLFQWKIAVL